MEMSTSMGIERMRYSFPLMISHMVFLEKIDDYREHGKEILEQMKAQDLLSENMKTTNNLECPMYYETFPIITASTKRKLCKCCAKAIKLKFKKLKKEMRL